MDYSRASTLLSCAKKYDWKYNQGLQDEGSEATRFGTAWHKIMEKHGENQGPVDVSAILAEAGWINPSSDYRTAEKLHTGYQMWLDHYKGVPWEIQHREMKTSVPIYKPFEPATTVIDGIAVTQDPYEDKLSRWAVDYKTTSRLESDWIAKYRVSNQFKWYLVAARELNLFPDIKGVCVDVYHATKGVKSSKDQNEHTGNRFHRLFFAYTDQELDESLRDYGAACNLRDHYASGGHWPKNTQACGMFNTTCAFLDLCDQANPELRERLKEQYK